MLVEMDAATFEVHMTRYNAQDITKKHFLRQLTVPPHKQTLLCITYIEKMFHTLFLSRNMALTNVLFIDNLKAHSQV